MCAELRAGRRAREGARGGWFLLLCACFGCESILGLRPTTRATAAAAAGDAGLAGKAGASASGASGRSGSESDPFAGRAGTATGGRAPAGGRGGSLGSPEGGSVGSPGDAGAAGSGGAGAEGGRDGGRQEGGGAAGVRQDAGASPGGESGEGGAAGGAAGSAECAPSRCVCNRALECIDPTWADWPMPNSPSGLAWPGVSSDPLPHPQHYDTTLPGTVVDSVTGLMWQAVLDARTFTWSDAKAYCPTLTLGGHHDWRLPSRIELVSIVDFARSGPALDDGAFPSTPPTYFWTASLNPPYAFYVNFDEGLVDYSSTSDTNTFRVRCVR